MGGYIIDKIKAIAKVEISVCDNEPFLHFYKVPYEAGILLLIEQWLEVELTLGRPLHCGTRYTRY